MVSFEDGVLRFIDFLVDAHELERNKQDFNKNFYDRANYTARNFHRYSNDTVANLMFDTQLRKIDYDRINSVVGRQTAMFYGAATGIHLLALSWSTYALRYRTLNKPQVLAVGTVFYLGFQSINSILYKTMVDKPVIDEARNLGLGYYVQPVGETRPRGHNY